MEKEVVLKKIKEKFEDQIDTSLVESATAKNNYKITLICKEHGKFTKSIYSLFNSKYGCTKCNRKYANDWHKLDFDTVIKKCKEIHDNYYSYELVKKWNNIGEKIDIICPIHGKVKVVLRNHLAGMKCRKCANDLIHIQQRNSTKDILNRVKEIHGNRYDYSKIDYKGMFYPIEVICKEHGSFFIITKDHISGNGCPKCNMSNLEEKVDTYLKNKKYNYIFQYKIEKCKRKKELPFDFGILDENNNLLSLIECQGELHYFPAYGEDVLKDIQERDLIKKNFCKKNNIPLIILPYKVFNKDFNNYFTNILKEII